MTSLYPIYYSLFVASRGLTWSRGGGFDPAEWVVPKFPRHLPQLPSTSVTYIMSSQKKTFHLLGARAGKRVERGGLFIPVISAVGESGPLTR